MDIICPICDEELGTTVEDVPEKCPICDTRKHEILQELCEQPKTTTFMVEDSKSEVVAPDEFNQASEDEPETNAQVIVESIEQKAHIIAEEEQVEIVEDTSEIVFEESSSHSQPVTVKEDTLKEKEEEIVFESDSKEEAIVFESDSKEEEIVFESDSKEEEIVFESDSKEEEIVFESDSKEDTVFESDSKEDTVFEEESEDIIFESGREQKKVEPVPKEAVSQPTTSGASSLEILPLGFKYCSSCEKVYPKNYGKSVCDCFANSDLICQEEGLPPGHYLRLYNANKKAIACFRLPASGSVFIGRSSERGSPQDIDLSVAWKHFYYKHFTSQEDFKEKMRLLKGISRKHALVRYSKEDEGYVIFHLSDKNYTVIQTPKGEKRVRAPKNRTKTELFSNSVILMGNQKDFIIMRYQVITL